MSQTARVRSVCQADGTALCAAIAAILLVSTGNITEGVLALIVIPHAAWINNKGEQY